MEIHSFRIEPLNLEDASGLNQLIVSNIDRFKRYLPKTLAANLNLENSKSYILEKSEHFQSKQEFTFAIKEKQTKKIAGLIIIKKINWELKKAEFAYCVGEEFKGKSLAIKGVKEVSNFAFTILKLETLQIISHKSNVSSIRVAESNGFKWQKTLTNEFTPIDELPLDMELYELKR